MAKKDTFDSIDIPEPCRENWDAMRGGDQTRFCANCEKDIYNLSAMTRREAKKLLSEAKESVCIRLEKDARGKVKTLKRQLHQITRQVPMAAGVLAASLTLTNAADAQKQPPRPPVGKVAVKNILDAPSTASLSGTITDVHGAAIPYAQIILLDANNKIVQKTVSNDEGFYELTHIKAGFYNLKVEARYFKKFSQRGLKIKADEKRELPIKLQVEKGTTIVGIFVMNEPIKIDEPKITDKIETRGIESLPAVNREKTPVLGLFPAAKSK